MNLAALIVREARYRFGASLLILVSVAVAVAVPVAFHSTALAADRETARQMRDLGPNLIVIAASADRARYFASGVPERTLPEDALDRLASRADFSYRHMIALLHRPISLDGVDCVLTGLSPERSPPGIDKPPMTPSVQPGTVVVGAVAAEALHCLEGQTLVVLERPFVVSTILSPKSSGVDDLRLYVDLAEAQQLLGMQGKIHEIQALDCFCADPEVDVLARLREQLASLVPEAQVLQRTAMADARSAQRRLTVRLFALQMPWLLGASATSLLALWFTNARARRGEIALLRALGRSSTHIAALILGKALFLGGLGGTLGWGLGTFLALWQGPERFALTSRALTPELHTLFLSWALAPSFAALCALVPTTWAVLQDPARALGEESGS